MKRYEKTDAAMDALVSFIRDNISPETVFAGLPRALEELRGAPYDNALRAFLDIERICTNGFDRLDEKYRMVHVDHAPSRSILPAQMPEFLDPIGRVMSLIVVFRARLLNEFHIARTSKI